VPVPGYVEAALSRIPRRADSPFVFPSKRGETPVSRNAVERWFPAVMAAIGIDAAARKERNLTFHGMRHTYITLLQKSGVSLMEAAALARKRDIGDAERRYTHGAQVVDLDAARERLNALGGGRH